MEKRKSASKEKPTDLYKTILDNIDKYANLCESEYAGPITRKEILSHIAENKIGNNVDCLSNKTGRKSQLAYKAIATVPKAPKFLTDKRLSQKDKSKIRSTEDQELEEINRLRQLMENQRKLNNDTVKGLQEYQKPVMKKKQNTTFKEFRLSTDARSTKHSEFRKNNLEKIEKEREMKRALKVQKRKEEEQR